MKNRSQFKPRLVILFFLLQVIINWLYIAWVENLPGLIINSWFVILPLLGYFYFTFAAIALVGLYYRKRPGLYLGYGVIGFGMTADVISYNLIFNIHALMAELIIPLIAVNVCVIGYMAYNNSYFTGE